MTGLLPPDSSGLFQDGELQEHNFAESSFTEDDVGTSVTEFDLTNVDTSNVQDMSKMFYGAEWFNQDIGNWDTSNVHHMSDMLDPTSLQSSLGGMFTGAKSFDQDLRASLGNNQIEGTPVKQTLSASSLADPERI